MVRSTWLRRVGPGATALVAVGLLASSTLGARDASAGARDCAPSDRLADLSVRTTEGPTSVAAGRAWFRLDPRLDPSGALAGQRLFVGRADGTGRLVLDLPPESFAAGPFGRVVLVGSDDGSGSRLVALDIMAGCATTVERTSDVIRRASVSPDGRSIVESRVDRATRADLGIWRLSVGADAQAMRILPAIEPDPRFGATWSTDLAWSTDGRRLAIQSCGEVACRTRVLDPATGALRLVDDPDLGPGIGLADGRLVAYLACHGLPCPLVAIDATDGSRRVLAADAGPAVLISTTRGPLVVAEDLGLTERRLASIALDGGMVQDLGVITAGVGLVADPSRSASAATIPAGWVVLAPDGRVPDRPDDRRPTLRRVIDGQISAFDEVLP